MTIGFSEIAAAHDRIRPLIHRTPLMSSQHLNEMVGGELFFKCENLQKCGAFKARGAFNAIYSLQPDELKHGVVTHSSGNHAAAVAIAAKSRQAPAYVVMPSTSPQPKKAAVAGYGATIVECEPRLEAREAAAKKLLAETGGTFLHPYDDYRIIAGQGTAAKELIEDCPNLDMILCPVGGGGLLAGTAISVSHLLPNAVLFGCEPLGADDAKRSFDAGHIIPQTNPRTIADGLLTSLGTRNFPIIQAHVRDILTVSDDAIIRAMRLIWQYMKIVIEPSSAVVLAALLTHQLNLAGKRVGLILSGGNVDLDKLPW